MNDGLDGRETVAFGLGAAEVAVFVLALLTAYAALRSGLPGVLEWSLAGLIAGTGAALAWGRVSGRSLLEWTVLLARFLARNRGRWPGSSGRVPAPPGLRTLLATTSSLVGRRGGSQAGAALMPLALRRHRAPSNASAGSGAGAQPAVTSSGRRQEAAPRRPQVEAFFSLNGGSGRTALAVELAALMAVRGTADRATGTAGMRVALLDLTTRSPAVALRLGIPVPAARAEQARMVTHPTGATVFPGPVPDLPSGEATARWARTLIGEVERGGADVIVVDIDCDLSALCIEALLRCDRVHITVSPTAGGVLDAYRSTAVLRRLGLRDRLDYVVNRCGGSVDMHEQMADLGGDIVAEIPLADAFVDAENSHRVAALGRPTPCLAALAQLADHIQERIPGTRPGIGSRWGSHAG